MVESRAAYVRSAAGLRDMRGSGGSDILEALGNLGDFIGGIAVVVTLVYLAIQVRQNTSALRTASWQAVVASYRENNRLRTHPPTALAWAKGLTGFPDLAFEDRNLFATVMVEEALCFQGAFALRKSGQLEDSTYQSYLDWFASVVATPGGRLWWESVGQPVFVPEMVAAVDQRLARGELHDIRSMPALELDEAPAA